MRESFDFEVIGGGIAGLSVASGLAPCGKVALIEREPALARHASGRSVAMFSVHSGNPVMRALTRASRSFFEAPPPAWRDGPLLTPRGLLVLAPPEQLQAVAQESAAGRGEAAPWQELDGMAAAKLMPILDAARVGRALFDPEARQIEVDALIAGYRRFLAAEGGTILLGVEVSALERHGARWRLLGRDLELAARIVVNAAGAWADELARRAGVTPVGIAARRRSIAVMAAPSGVPATAIGW